MKSVRVTKYDPRNRDENDYYTLGDEWTSIADVGKLYEGHIFTTEQYLAAEEKYIKAVKVLMQQTGINELKIVDLENHSQVTEMDLSEGKIIPRYLVKELVKMILREKVWGKLVANNQFEIHFGHDYYMYFVGVGLTDEINRELKKIEGLYVEEVPSPYLD